MSREPAEPEGGVRDDRADPGVVVECAAVLPAGEPEMREEDDVSERLMMDREPSEVRLVLLLL